MKRSTYLSLFALLGFTAIPAHAFTTGFESGEGYSVGELVGQPSSGTQWTGTTGLATVVTSGGNPGGYASIAGIDANLQSVIFAPTDLDLGGTFPQNVAFSFDIRNDSYNPLDSSTFGRIVVLRDASGSNQSRSLRIQFKGNGNVDVVSDDGLFTVSTFIDNSTFVNFSGILNFTDQTSILKIGDTDVNGGNPFAFSGITGSGSDAYGFFEASVSGASNSYSLDNLALTAVPEPGTASVLLGGLATLLAFQRLRNRRRAA